MGELYIEPRAHIVYPEVDIDLSKNVAIKILARLKSGGEMYTCMCIM